MFSTSSRLWVAVVVQLGILSCAVKHLARGLLALAELVSSFSERAPHIAMPWAAFMGEDEWEDIVPYIR